jgi:predicted phosphohydrolase
MMIQSDSYFSEGLVETTNQMDFPKSINIQPTILEYPHDYWNHQPAMKKVAKIPPSRRTCMETGRKRRSTSLVGRRVWKCWSSLSQLELQGSQPYDRYKMI